MNLQSKPEPREFEAQPSPFPSKAGDWRLEEDEPEEGKHSVGMGGSRLGSKEKQS